MEKIDLSNSVNQINDINTLRKLRDKGKLVETVAKTKLRKLEIK